jgi:hypothetical protein
MYKIMWVSQYGKEEIDNAETREEANKMVDEYNMAFHGGCYKVKCRG